MTTPQPSTSDPKYIITGAVLVIVLIVLSIPAAREWFNWLNMRGELRTVEAQVVEVENDFHNYGETVGRIIGILERYKITYTFVVTAPDGTDQGYTARKLVSQRFGDQVEAGSTITVEYSAANPRSSNIVGNTYARTVRSFYPLAAILGLLILALMWQSERR